MLDYITAEENVVSPGSTSNVETRSSIGLAIRACQAGHRVDFAAAPNGSPDWPRPPHRKTAGRTDQAGLDSC